MLAVYDARVRLARSHVNTGFTERLLSGRLIPTEWRNRSAKPWSPSAVRGRRSEQNRWMPVIAGTSNLVRVQAITA